MRFAISMTDIAGAWEALEPQQQADVLSRHTQLKEELAEAGCFVEALHFHPHSEARTVRMDADGTLTTTDGPFSNATEYVGGIYVIECDSMEEAVAWARRARFMIGANEVRQVWD